MSKEDTLKLSMESIMKTLDTGMPQVDRLVLAYIDREEGKDGVRLRFLTDEEKQNLVTQVNENK